MSSSPKQHVSWLPSVYDVKITINVDNAEYLGVFVALCRKRRVIFAFYQTRYSSSCRRNARLYWLPAARVSAVCARCLPAFLYVCARVGVDHILSIKRVPQPSTGDHPTVSALPFPADFYGLLEASAIGWLAWSLTLEKITIGRTLISLVRYVWRSQT